MTTDRTDKIGIVAGGGQFPLLFAQAAKKKGRQVVAVAHEGESLPGLAEAVDKIYWIKLGQLGKMIRHLKDEGVSETALLGTITKTKIFKDVWPDLKALAMWSRIDTRQDDAILRAVAEELEKDGIRVVPSTLYLSELLFPKGVMTRKKPSAAQIDDIKFGWHAAREIGKLDIGQCVVVRGRSVLAVEAIEGTDATIKRGGTLAGENAVVVKTRKPGQDFRFDLPAVGPSTIDSMVEVRAAVLAIEAGQSVLFDREDFISRADEAGIVVLGVEETNSGELSF